MLYYRVKPMYDNKRLCLCKCGRYIHNGDILIGGELYTLKEWDRLKKSHVFGCNPADCVELVNISKNNIYFFFGARFESR